jgi:hypothetical protein
MTAPQTPPSIPHANGREANGRFTKGNPGGPGNPFYRRQAELRRAVLALFTPEDVAALLRVMLALGRNGDVAAAKVFLEYVVGKPHKAPDPDREEHHEWQLFAEAPRLAEVHEVLENGVPADLANDATREVVPQLAANRLEDVFDSLNVAPPPEPAAARTEEPVAQPSAAQWHQEALRLLLAQVRAAVANGVTGTATEQNRPPRCRLTEENGGSPSVATEDNGLGSTVPPGDNGRATVDGTELSNRIRRHELVGTHS